MSDTKTWSEKLVGVKITFGYSLVFIFSLVAFAGGSHWSVVGFNLACLATTYLFVLAHELGHVCAAARVGGKCSGIHIFMFGGAALLPNMTELGHEHPIRETLIAVAGPAVSLVYAGIFGVMYYYWPNPGVRHVLFINTAILVFNLIPVFPLDGGRVFRSLLAQVFSYRTATKIAGNTAILGCILLFYVGWVWNPVICVVSVLVILFSHREVKADLVFDSNVRAIPQRKSMPSYGVPHTDLEKKYVELVSGGMEPQEALMSAYRWRFPGSV